ncbi:hypothetical protein Q5P01_021975 [Channa striata]|uniref:Uncharacterized protein n=1 Tax=Channa striata TaxID=64152 RepID=A0AA88LRA2_CHASR|nr:hypothetical protein Q5P01_021975 [Channa striata]
MHCGKGHTHFIYLEETRNDQPKGKEGNNQKQRTDKEIKVDFGDTKTAEFVSQLYKGVSERSGTVSAEGGAPEFSMYGLQPTAYE